VTTERTGNRRGQRSRAEILDVATRVMAQRGYAATSLSTLSAESGLPKSVVYHHFHSKGGLLSAVMERGLNDFFAAMRAAHADPPEGGTHRERLSWFLERTSEVLVARQEFMRLHLLLVLSAEADEAEVAGTIDTVRRDGRVLMNDMIRASFLDEGPEIAQAVADELDYFGIAGFDGAFIASQADPSRVLPPQTQLLADALVLLGEQIVARLRAADS
jgi:AcrR family transcriptional regulator